MVHRLILKYRHFVCFVIIAFIIILAGVWFIRNNAEFEIRLKIVASKAFSISGSPEIILIGDSRVKQWKNNCLAKSNKASLNLGVSNSTTKFWLQFVSKYVDEMPVDVDVVLWFGINDLTGDRSTHNDIIKNINYILDLLNRQTKRIIVISQIPVSVLPHEWNINLNEKLILLNRSIKDISNMNDKVLYLDVYNEYAENISLGNKTFYSDSIHLSASGDKLICNVLQSELRNITMSNFNQ